MARSNKRTTSAPGDRSANRPECPRLFIAAPLPPAVRDHLGQLTDDLSARDLPVRWTATAALHLTFHFVGEVPPERAELIRLAFANFTLPVGPIRLRTAELGSFPNPKRPRVIWIGLRGATDRLSDVHQRTGDLLTRLDVDHDDRGFRPHVTLGRAREGVDALFGFQLASAMKSPSVEELIAHPVEFSIGEVHLYRSHLERSGARYESLARVAVGNK